MSKRLLDMTCTECHKNISEMNFGYNLTFLHNGKPYCMNCLFKLVISGEIDADINAIKITGMIISEKVERLQKRKIFDKHFFNLDVLPN